jgi:hypothetical protein
MYITTKDIPMHAGRFSAFSVPGGSRRKTRRKQEKSKCVACVTYINYKTTAAKQFSCS